MLEEQPTLPPLVGELRGRLHVRARHPGISELVNMVEDLLEDLLRLCRGEPAACAGNFFEAAAVFADVDGYVNSLETSGW